MRIYTSCSDPIDFCKHCFPDADEAEERYGDVGEGPDGRGNATTTTATIRPTGGRVTPARNAAES